MAVFVYNTIKSLAIMYCSKIPIREPWNKFLMAFVMTVVLSLLVIIIGFIIQQVKNFFFNLFSNHVGDTFAKIICFRLTFPGTVIHEFSHALFGFLTGAKINKIQCFSLKKDTLGYVEYTAQGSAVHRMLQHSFASCAPVIMGLICCPLFVSLAIGVTGLGLKILFWYLAVSVLLHMNMSSVDIKNYFKGYPVVFLILFAGLYLSIFIRI